MSYSKESFNYILSGARRYNKNISTYKGHTQIDDKLKVGLEKGGTVTINTNLFNDIWSASEPIGTEEQNKRFHEVAKTYEPDKAEALPGSADEQSTPLMNAMENFIQIIDFIVNNDIIDSIRPTYKNWSIGYTDVISFRDKQRFFSWQINHVEEGKGVVDHFIHKGMVPVKFEGGNARRITHLFLFYNK